MCATNSSATFCPDHDTLKAYLLGVLAGDDAAKLDEHISTCDCCIQSAQQLSTDDELIDAIRSAKTHAGLDDETVDSLIDRLSQLPAQSKSQPHDDTVSLEVNSSESIGDFPAPPLPPQKVPDFLAPAEQPDEIGRLGDYRILEVLGAGGMGIVFRAEDMQLKRAVAIKAMLPEVAAKENAKKRFLREAQATAAIEHDNIVTIYQVAEDRGTAFFDMQFLRGESLEDRIRRMGKLDDRETLRIGREIAAGLAAAHAEGLLHRDIKPDNIWLEEGTGRVKIVDFGLARLDETEDTQLTQSGAVLGTPKYMAPEQALGQEVDQRCDLFSLGSVLYRLTTASAPFEGANVTATLISVANEDPRPIRELNPNASPALVEVIDKLLQKQPERRFQSADEVVAVIRQIENDLATAAHEPTAAFTPQISPQPARYRRVMIATSTAIILAFLCGVIILLRTRTGVLRIEVDDPNLTVLVDGTEIELTDKKWRGERTAEKHRLAIKLGDQTLRIGSPAVVKLDDGQLEHHLTVQLNGAALSSNEFSIDRDGETVLRISFTPTANENASAAAATIPPAINSPDDRAATLREQIEDGVVSPADGWVDLVPLFDPKLDALKGDWIVDDLGLRCKPSFNAKARFPLRIDGAYELEIDVTHSSGTSSIVTAIPVGQHDVIFVPAGSVRRLGVISGFGVINGKDLDTNGTARGEQSTIGRRFTLKFRVQLSGETARITIWKDGEAFRDWNGRQDALNAGTVWNAPENNQFGFGGTSALLTLHSARLRMLDGEAKLLRPPPRDEFRGANWELHSPPPAIAPFGGEQAKKHQQAWADYLGLPDEKQVELPGGAKMAFMLIPPGEFLMGSTAEEQATLLEEAKAANDARAIDRIPSEGPQHRVRITRPFYLGKYEVTKTQWQAVMGNGPSQIEDSPADRVAQVSWGDIQLFQAKLNEGGSAGPMKFALPTEAQWEYACRAGTTSDWYGSNSEDDLRQYGWFDANADGKTHPVGQLKANAFGLYDLHGNVWEWCADWYAVDYYANSPVDDPTGPSAGSYRVGRGGAWLTSGRNCRSAYRAYHAPGDRGHNLGFRLAMTIDMAQLKPKLTPTEILTSPDWEWTAPEPIAEVNSEALDAFPTISGDGLTMVFASSREGGQGDGYDLWISERASVTDPWGEPQNLGPQVNSSGFDETPELSHNGLTLIFAQSRPGSRSGDLFVTSRSGRDASWSSAVALGGPINTSADEQNPSLSEDGLTLMFCSNRPGGIPDRKKPTYDLWVSRRDTLDTPWKRPTNLGPPINTSNIEKGCCLSSDGLTLLFSGDDLKRTTRSDRYMAHRKSSDEPWSKPVRLPDIFQADSQDADTELSSDGREVYVELDEDIHVIRRVPKRANAAATRTFKDSPADGLHFDGETSYVRVPTFK